MPGGRPSPIDKVIGHRDVDGQQIEVTVFDRIVASVRVCAPLYEAADAAGVGRDTVAGWIKLAGKLELQHRGSLENVELTHHERRCIEFSQAVREARAQWVIDANTLHERIARGGIPQEVTTEERDEAGKLLKRTVRRTTTSPDPRTLEWRFKYLRPDLYADRLELTGAGGGPIEMSQEDKASALTELVRSYRQQSEDPPARRPRPKVKELTDGSDPAG